MTSVEEWRTFLQKWSDGWLSTGESFPPAVGKARWLGFKPASEKQIEQLERRLGYELPPSFRAFLSTTNGWRRTSAFVERIRPAKDVRWLEVDDPQLVDIWCGEDEGPLGEVSQAAYFSYDGRTPFKSDHFRKSLKIADPVAGDSMIYVLNPEVVADDGEWEAWRHASWIPGAERYPSFAYLMRAEYESFRSTELGIKTRRQLVGPFDGHCAPNHPRHRAERTGPGARRPRRRPSRS